MSLQTKGHRARKRFGQNFLHDENVIANIANSIHATADDCVLEIGPGKGAITEALLASGAQVFALEIDRDLAALLQEKYAGVENFELINIDALKFDPSSLPLNGRLLRVVGNLPYNISTPILFHLLKHRQVIRDMTFMLQNEVVDRISASSGNKVYGRLSVMMQYYCQAEKLFTVPPGAFNPAPRVMSAIIRLQVRDQMNNEKDNPEPFYETLERLVRMAFAQRRKTLQNNLKGLLTADTIKRLGIDPSIRAEQLTVDSFVLLANSIERLDDEPAR